MARSKQGLQYGGVSQCALDPAFLQCTLLLTLSITHVTCDPRSHAPRRHTRLMQSLHTQVISIGTRLTAAANNISASGVMGQCASDSPGGNAVPEFKVLQVSLAYD